MLKQDFQVFHTILLNHPSVDNLVSVSGGSRHINKKTRNISWYRATRPELKCFSFKINSIAYFNLNYWLFHCLPVFSLNILYRRFLPFVAFHTIRIQVILNILYPKMKILWNYQYVSGFLLTWSLILNRTQTSHRYQRQGLLQKLRIWNASLLFPSLSTSSFSSPVSVFLSHGFPILKWVHLLYSRRKL